MNSYLFHIDQASDCGVNKILAARIAYCKFQATFKLDLTPFFLYKVGSAVFLNLDSFPPE